MLTPDVLFSLSDALLSEPIEGLPQVTLLAVASGAGYVAGKIAQRFAKPSAKASTLGPGLMPVSRNDGLTGLAARNALVEHVSTALASQRAHALFMLNVNEFSTINAALGYSGGDQILKTIADRLSKLRLDGRWARTGPDEFGLVLPLNAARDDVEWAAVTILRCLSEPIATFDREIACSASLGISLLPAHAGTADGALLTANIALRRAKSVSGGSWCIYDAGLDEASRSRAALKEELKLAIDAGQIVPYYQPIVDLKNGSIVGLEVLARWEHPTRGLLLPDLFIPMAEEAQLAGSLTQTLMRRVVADTRRWPAHLYFAFNISPCQLREFIGMVQSPPVWPEGSIDPRRLAIEITESAMIEDIDLARELIDILQAQGTSIVLDDFGIGYSNFLHLRELPFDRIKIDKSFILDCAFDPRANACIRAMLAVSQSLDIDMVAEGLETPEMARFVASLGCRYGQGYVFSKPAPAEEVGRLLTPKRQLVLVREAA